MTRKYKDYFSYYAWFNKIKGAHNSTVGHVRGRTVYSNDENFLNFVKSGISRNNSYVEFHKHNYNVVDEVSGEMVGIIDDRFNVFNKDHEYSGTIHNMTRVAKFVLITSVVVIIIFLIMILMMLRTTKDSVKVHDIHITENDGMVVEEKWNIFGETEADKVIEPGKKGTYIFTINNDNFFDVVCEIDFSEANEYDLPVRYRLREGNYKYLKGDSDTYLDVYELGTDSIVVPARGFVTLALDWYWVNDGTNNPGDTTGGNAVGATYTVYVKIVGEERTK